SLIQYCERMGDTSQDFNMLGIITTAEPLTVGQRKVMKDFFNCDVVARYAMEELGIIANQCIHTENYHVNDASFILEVLKKDNDIDRKSTTSELQSRFDLVCRLQLEKKKKTKKTIHR